jgi:hypothetical protein
MNLLTSVMCDLVISEILTTHSVLNQPKVVEQQFNRLVCSLILKLPYAVQRQAKTVLESIDWDRVLLAAAMRKRSDHEGY